MQSDYPYTAHTGSCSFNASLGKVKVERVNTVPSNSVEQLKAAIASGPVSVTVQADTSVFQMYSSGILDSEECGTNLDHAITAVGFGTEGGQDFYIVRNSWGASWGDHGYIKIAAVEGAGICGI